MEKIFQILIVFGLLMFVVSRFTRGRQQRFREYVYRGRQKGNFLSLLVGELVLASPGLAEDVGNGLLFRVAGPALEVWDAQREVVLARLELTVPVESVLFDPGTRLIYCTGVLSSLYIIQQQSREQYELLQWLTIPEGAGPVGLSLTDKTIYCQSADFYYTFTQA